LIFTTADWHSDSKTTKYNDRTSYINNISSVVFDRRDCYVMLSGVKATC